MSFARIWKWFLRALLVAGSLLSFLVLIELLRVFVFLHSLHPVAGWTYATVLAVGGLAGFTALLHETHRYPRALIPPPLPDLEAASHAALKRYTKYLMAYGQRLLRNPLLPGKEKNALREALDTISGHLQHHPLNDDLIRFIRQMDDKVLPPLLKQLKDVAEKEIRRSVRDVMLGVTLSPYHSIDVLIVLYRNSSMIFRIMRVYETTPVPRAQWRILRDVIRVVATVNFLYVGRNLIENLFAFVPWIGRVADDIGQGLGAGLFTSAAGHAAIDRCAAYRHWEKNEAAESLAAQSRDFLRDVRNIFTKDVLPDIKNRILSESPETAVQEPGFWERVQNGITTAIDSTVRGAGGLFTSSPPANDPGLHFPLDPPKAQSDDESDSRDPLLMAPVRFIGRNLKKLWPFE